MEDNDLKLRDEIAMKIMEILFVKYNPFQSYIEQGIELNPNLPKTKSIARVAYIVADEMRKARLASFK